MSNIQQLADGAMFFAGFCANAEELQHARGGGSSKAGI